MGDVGMFLRIILTWTVEKQVVRLWTVVQRLICEHDNETSGS
jgi:hypothetical protein